MIAQWQAIDLTALPPTLQQQSEHLLPMLTFARDSLDLALVLPDMLGVSERRDYLFIAQNEDERRATGGFISAVGTMSFEQGQLTALTVDHTDVFTGGPYPPPPLPFQRYMGIQLWVFRDGNWSPDVPTAARTLLQLYQIEHGTRPSHLLAFNQTALRLLLQATGPVVVEGQSTPVSATTLSAYIRTEYDRSIETGVHRKAFLGPLLQAIIARIQHESASIDLLTLATALKQALDERHLLLYTPDRDAARALANLGWDGAVHPGDQDFLLLVDSNMGYSKANVYIDQAITYTVDLRNPTMPTAMLAIQHHHTLASATPQFCPHWSEQPLPADMPSRYAALTDRCYWNALRVFTPPGSTLIDATSQPPAGSWGLPDLDDGVVTSAAGERATQVFATFLVVPPGGVRETVLRYQLPAGVLRAQADGWHYQLKLQKQAGQEAIPVQVEVLLPATAQVLDTGGLGAVKDGNQLQGTLQLNHDQTLDVSFR
ncbi:MAG: DUF4012 domain-containing protein [Chloroflexaceae bacterium]|nr:DUF4012 domain-containing protein [Chloroflexaceae bacterium]